MPSSPQRRPPPFGRRRTIFRALRLLRDLHPGRASIVETGTLRSDTGSSMASDGWSTMAWGWYCSRFGGRAHTVDVDAGNLAVCRRVTARYADVIEYVEDDSVNFLQAWAGHERRPIHLLYLDSLDYVDRRRSEAHSRAEAEAALPSLAPASLVLVDDTWTGDGPSRSTDAGFGGKGARSVPFLLERGFRLEWCEDGQALLSRREE